MMMMDIFQRRMEAAMARVAATGGAAMVSGGGGGAMASGGGGGGVDNPVSAGDS
jgi:hypothetical protein